MPTIIAAPFEIEECEKFGRYLVATRDCPAGQLIFKEVPICTYSKFKRTEHSKDYVSCMTCFRTLKKSEKVSCKYCKWSFCSRRCAKDSLHRTLECDILTKNRVSPCRKASCYIYLLRLLQLKEKDSIKWEQLLNLSCKFGLANPDDEFIYSCAVAHKFLTTRCKLDVSLSLVKRLNYVLFVNQYSFDDSKEDRTTYAVYETASLLSHSCAPCVEWCLHPGKKEKRGTMSLIARRDIHAGEMLTVAYKFDYSSKGTHQRRAGLLKDFNFFCSCKRCEDPTELGTYFSAIACSRCPDGWLLPSCLFDDQKFICEKCNFCLEESEAVGLTKSFAKKMNATDKVTEMAKEKYLDALITNATVENRLHANHHLVIEANLLWIDSVNWRILVQNTPESEEMFHKLIARAERNLEIANLFGNISHKVNLHSIIAMSSIHYYFKSSDYLSIGEDLSDLNEKISAIEKIVNHLHTSINIADPSVFGDWTKKTVNTIKERYKKWNSRLTKCRAKSLKQKAK